MPPPATAATTFRNSPEGVAPKAKYDNKVRDLVLERILRDGMNVERALESIRREFLLDLSTGFVYDVLRDRAGELDMAAHRREVLDRFSGTLCVDELHLGRFTLLLATDPLADLPVAFALVAKNDQDHMRRFLRQPQELGPGAPRWWSPTARTSTPPCWRSSGPTRSTSSASSTSSRTINELILDAVRRMRAAMARRGKAGRRKRRGRKGAKSKARAARRGMTVKEKANFIFKRRHLVVKRREDLTEQERDDLRRMMEYLPELARLRLFADRIYWLFDAPKDAQQAGCRRSAILRDPSFRAVPELVKAMEQLDEGKFRKLTAYLRSPLGSAGEDQQPRGADQPDVPVPREGAVQVAAAEDAGAVRGPDTGRDLEAMVPRRAGGRHRREAGQTSRDATP